MGSVATSLSAEDIIRLLDLQPHPEGGHYRETFRDSRSIDAVSGRAASTAIYFLLRASEISRWHKVDAAEVWHWYAGAPLALSIVDGRQKLDVRLGADLTANERPQAAVPAGAWQQAQSLGAWTLAGCTVAPGFEFAGFEMAPPEFNPLGP
jgi:predicted cupin superfamily sugar epimerase